MAETSAPKIGDRRPREWRCERCDRPLTDEVWTTWKPMWPLVGADPITDWREENSTDTRCAGEPFCDAPETDWRARAKGAEARVAALEAELVETLVAKTGACFVCHKQHPEHATWCSLGGGTQALDRALDAAEARGRQHGLLAGAMLLHEKLFGFYDNHPEHRREGNLADAGKYLIGTAALDNAFQDVDRLASSAAPPDAKETP